MSSNVVITECTDGFDVKLLLRPVISAADLNKIHKLGNFKFVVYENDSLVTNLSFRGTRAEIDEKVPEAIRLIEADLSKLAKIAIAL